LCFGISGAELGEFYYDRVKYSLHIGLIEIEM
jgi:hypothetical protein